MTELALKTPLNALQRDYVETVNSSAQSLLDLLNDILDFSKIEAGKLELEVIDFGLRDVLEDALATYAGRCHSKGIELILDVRPDVPDALIGDPYRLRQVVLNLVSNALRFTTHGEVVVRAEISQINEIETLLRFTISDTGCGIDGDKREAIFNAFTQADNSTTRRFGGTGLGLAICKQLVQLMGGWISVKSDPGRGSEFQFRARFGVGPALSAGKKYHARWKACARGGCARKECKIARRITPRLGHGGGDCRKRRHSNAASRNGITQPRAFRLCDRRYFSQRKWRP
jgi:protein-histidine pros-kinase